MPFDPLLSCEPSTPLGVVPIVVNAGAALGPMLVAPIATFFRLLFKPAALVALIRRKPWLPVPILLGGVGIYFLISWALAPAPAAGAARKADAAGGRGTVALKIPDGDWTKLALRLIRDEQFAAKTTGLRPVREYFPDEAMMVLTAPAVTADRVFAGLSVQDGPAFIGQLFAVDRQLRPVWKVDKVGEDYLKAIFSSPVVSPDGKSVIVGQGLHEDRNCSLVCVDAATGAPRWTVKTPLHIESTPAVWRDLVVVGAGAIEGADHLPTGDPGFVVAVQISTGQQVWKHAVNDPESSPVIDDQGVTYVGAGFNGNAVVALRPEPDDELKAKKLPREIWKTAAPYPITGPVTLAGDLVIVGGGKSDFVNVAPEPAGVVIALDRKTGQIKWQAKTEDSVLGRIVVKGNVAYCPVLSGTVLAVDLTTGKRLWNQPAAGRSLLKAGLTIVDDALLVVTADGYLVLMRAADGTVIEKHPLNAPGKSSKEGLNVSTPVTVGKDVYLGTQTGGLRQFELIGGK